MELNLLSLHIWQINKNNSSREMHTEPIPRVHHPLCFNVGIFARNGHTIKGCMGMTPLPFLIRDDFFRDHYSLPSFLFLLFRLWGLGPAPSCIYFSSFLIILIIWDKRHMMVSQRWQPIWHVFVFPYACPSLDSSKKK